MSEVEGLAKKKKKKFDSWEIIKDLGWDPGYLILFFFSSVEPPKTTDHGNDILPYRCNSDLDTDLFEELDGNDDCHDARSSSSSSDS